MGIQGINVVLIDKEKIGTDKFNRPIYQEKEITVDNVLIAPSNTDDITTSVDMTGKKAVYTLAIPKNDDHIWKNKKVKFFNEEWMVLGFEIQGIDANIPLCWNKKVMVERYE